MRTSGVFRCTETTCKYTWHSKHVWIRFDLYLQSTKLFGQTCPQVQNVEQLKYDFKEELATNIHLQKYILPSNFNDKKWFQLCKKAVKSKFPYSIIGLLVGLN